MTDTGSHYRGLASIVGLLLACACTSEPATDHLVKAQEFLKKGYYRPAVVEFDQARLTASTDEGRCIAEYGFGLAVLHGFGSDIFTSITDLGGLTEPITGMMPPAALPSRAKVSSHAVSRRSSGPPVSERGNPDAIINNMIDPFFSEYIDPAASALETAAKGGCHYLTGPEGVPIATGLESTAWIGTDFTPAYAKLLGGTLRLMQGMVAFISAHDITTDLYALQDTLDIIPQTDLIGVVRYLGLVMTTSKTFLGFSASRAGHLVEAPGLLTGGLDLLASGLEEFLSGAEGADARDDVLGYVDKNGNRKLDFGDEIWVGIVRAEPPLEILGTKITNYPAELSRGDFGSTAGLLLTILGDPIPGNAIRVIRRVRESIQGSTNLLNLAELNSIVPLGLSPFPSTMAVDLSKLFTGNRSTSKPLREMGPVWGAYNPPGGEGTALGDPHPIFLIEGELPANADKKAIRQEVDSNDAEVYCHTCKPGGHFSSQIYGAAAGLFTPDAEVSARLKTPIEPLAEDCITPARTVLATTLISTPIPTPYAYWQDPTMNGSLFVDLAPITSELCATADKAFVGSDPEKNPVPLSRAIPASNYSLNKAMAAFFGDLSSLIGAATFLPQ